MLKSLTILEIKRDDRVYTLMLPPNCQAGELFDVLSDARGMVLKILTDSQNPPTEKKEEKQEKIG